MARARRFPVFADAGQLDADLEHSTPAARAALQTWLATTERDGGVLAADLRACQVDARDGTSLPNCVKSYVPQPAGQWGVVMCAVRGPSGELRLRLLAFGVRHPAGQTPSVYQLAHDRLHTGR